MSSYYDLFDRMTHSGRVFTEDLSDVDVSRTTLTSQEERARTEYTATVETLRSEYKKRVHIHPIATTKEEVLQQRVVAPCLASSNVSSRSAAAEPRASRVYPHTIHPWNTFRQEVERYKINEDSTSMGETMDMIFYFSLDRANTEASNEAQEQIRLTDNLDKTLKRAGIVHSVHQTRGFGRMDFCIMKDDASISIVCECKSTHNLLLPMTAEKCKTEYDQAYSLGASTYQRSRGWSNVAHPIGQLLSYMVDNNHRCGALTSGTRTYFLKIQGSVNTSSNPEPGDQVQTNTAHHIATSNAAKRVKSTGSDVPVAKNQHGHREESNLDSHCIQSAQYLLGGPSAETNKESKPKATSQNQKTYPNTNDSDSGNISAISDSYFELDSEMKVCISDAWCVGEANYLRAWAYMHTLYEPTKTLRDSLYVPTKTLRVPKDWIKSTNKDGTPKQWKQYAEKKADKSSSPSDVRDSGNDYGGGSTKSCNNMEHFYPIHHGALDFVPFDEIVIGDVLGNGRNGACFKVRWNGVEYAMKQFDIGRDGDVYFEKEIRAYMLLQKVWGVLVPRPMFLSESYSGGIMLLGLQLGRESTSVDDLRKFAEVLQRLATEYGIQHNDAENGRNMIIITNADGVERVVAIDFEDWEKYNDDF